MLQIKTNLDIKIFHCILLVRFPIEINSILKYKQDQRVWVLN